MPTYAKIQSLARINEEAPSARSSSSPYSQASLNKSLLVEYLSDKMIQTWERGVDYWLNQGMLISSPGGLSSSVRNITKHDFYKDFTQLHRR